MAPAARRIKPLPRNLFRYLCLLTALANSGALLLLLFYRTVFDLLNVPLPTELFNFAFVSGFAFTAGVLALLVFLNPEKNSNLLIVGITGKGLYSFFTFYFYVFYQLHWFYLIFGIWDAIFVVVFLLFLTQLLSPDLSMLNAESTLPRTLRSDPGKALLLYFSLTGTCASGMEQVRAGLEEQGYAVDIKLVKPVERLFHFPLSLLEFIRISIRAIFRRPAPIVPLELAGDHDYDLIVVGTQTWLAGMSAPVEAIFQDPQNREAFAGRDVAVLVVCRGLWRRSQAMTVRWAESLGARVVGVRAACHTGWEPSRIFSLWFYLIFREAGRPRFLDGLVQKRYGLSDETLAQLKQFGRSLAAASAEPETSIRFGAARGR